MSFHASSLDSRISFKFPKLPENTGIYARAAIYGIAIGIIINWLGDLKTNNFTTEANLPINLLSRLLTNFGLGMVLGFIAVKDIEKRVLDRPSSTIDPSVIDNALKYMILGLFTTIIVL